MIISTIFLMVMQVPVFLWWVGMADSIVFLVAIGFMIRAILKDNFKQFTIWRLITSVNLMIAIAIMFSA